MQIHSNVHVHYLQVFRSPYNASYVVKWTNEEKWCDGALYVVTDLKLLVCHMNKKITIWCLDRAL